MTPLGQKEQYQAIFIYMIVIDKDENKVLDEAYNTIINKGFPFYPTDRKWRDDTFNQLYNFKRDTLIDRKNKVIGQSAHGLNLAWSYMEHAWGIKCGKMRTPVEIWNDEEHLKKGINKILTGTFFKQKAAHQIKDTYNHHQLKNLKLPLLMVFLQVSLKQNSPHKNYHLSLNRFLNFYL